MCGRLVETHVIVQIQEVRLMLDRLRCSVYVPAVYKTIYLQLEMAPEIGPTICRPVLHQMAAA